MARESLLIELDGKAVDYLHELMPAFGERNPDDMIATALGLLGTLKRFVHDGVLTVVDPNPPSRDPEDREVDVVFGKLKRNPTKEAA
jgi:hypothetical protein